jgi:ubiquinone/menaquinone biosynthesis C-methylase UbiE
LVSRIAYFNSMAERWDAVAAEKDRGKLRALADRLDIAKGSTVLDVGTGTGVFAPFLLEKIGETGKLVCLDFAEEMLNRARQKGFKGNIEYVLADIQNSMLRGKSFDAIVCYSSFPHFVDKPKALGEIRHLLKEDGRLFICHSSGRQQINEVHSHVEEVRGDLIPDEEQMRGLLAAAGFVTIEVYDASDSYLASAKK